MMAILLGFIAMQYNILVVRFGADSWFQQLDLDYFGDMNFHFDVRFKILCFVV